MDHIPLPKNPTWGRLEIPCLTEQDYDGGDPRSYPAREGFGDRTHFEWEKLLAKPPQGFVRFMQRWRYFGLIARVFRYPDGTWPTVTDLSRLNADNERVLDTSKLPDIARQTILAGGVAESQKYGSLMSRCEFAKRFFLKIEGSQSAKKSQPHLKDKALLEKVSLSKYYDTLEGQEVLPEMIAYSVLLLHEFIGSVLDFAPLYLHPSMQHTTLEQALSETGDRTSYQPNSQNACARQMVSAGWCPARIEELKMILPLSGMLYVANLPRLDNKDHRTCTADMCFLAKIKDCDYNTLHDHDGEDCEHVEPDLGQLTTILETSTFPVMKCSIDAAQSSISLEPFDPEVPYVAISHVWSDGLGNPRNNSIPRCQFRRLSDLVREVGIRFPALKTSAFWLDTVCCPVEDGSRIQNIALEKMKDTYKNAAAVLILDSYLLQQTAADLTNVERLMRVLCCRWTGRLW